MTANTSRTDDGRTESVGTPVIGVLAVQGSFADHLNSLARLGVEGRPVRRPADLDDLDGLIVPGGESTVMADLTRESGLFDRLAELGARDLPLFGTCAGAILLGRGDPYPPRLGLAPVVVERNAYGRQLESFEAAVKLAPFDEPFVCIFIRAPRIHIDPAAPAGGDVEILGRERDDPVLVRYRNILLSTFHPELAEDDLRVHRYFLELVESARRPGARPDETPSASLSAAG